MRYVNVSTAALLALFLVSSAVTASESDDFDDWWRAKSGEIDGRWAAAAHREAGVPLRAGADPSATAERAGLTRKAPGPAQRASRNNTGSLPQWSGSMNPNFSSRVSGDNLWRSTKERSGATRGTSLLANPSDATRSSAAVRRKPANNNWRYRNKDSYSRTSAWRLSPKDGQRLRRDGSSMRMRSSASSYTRGSTRMRRSARSPR